MDALDYAIALLEAAEHDGISDLHQISHGDRLIQIRLGSLCALVSELKDRRRYKKLYVVPDEDTMGSVPKDIKYDADVIVEHKRIAKDKIGIHTILNVAGRVLGDTE